MLERRAIIEKVTLAMHKFGGDGTIYIDLVKDDNGKPGLIGYRSKPVFVEIIKNRPGYYWVDFVFPENVELTECNYWIVLRQTGEVIINWFYIPGNPFSPVLLRYKSK